MMGGLSDNHKRRLLTTFGHVDRLLNGALRALDGADAASPFASCIPDSLPIQRKVLADYLAGLRARMIAILQRHGIEIPPPAVSSLWAFRTALMTAAIAIEELKPKYMRGYGELTEDATRDLEALASQLADVLDRMGGYLSGGPGPDLQARLMRLEKTTLEAEGARVLEQVITAHGLVELRAALDIVVERLESDRWEIAVFGRVSSGKSSLLNHILRTDALPVGVTPVTGIPTRVAFGPRPQARIEFAEQEPMTVALPELAQYVTEQGNPNNTRHVTHIQVELPADRLKEGVTFVDTPGLGSLARYGATEAMACLPRCDLGVVLVDAASTLLADDAVVVDALRRAGADVVVLLTKGDILTTEERSAAARYVAAELAAQVGCDVPVHVVSVKGRDAELCDRWFDTWLAPRLQEHRRLAQASLRRKIGLLRDATVAALQRRLEKRSGIRTDSLSEWPAAESGLSAGLAQLESAACERPAWPGLPQRILDDAARRIADEWRTPGSVRVNGATAVVSCANAALGAAAAGVAKSLTELRDGLVNALHAASVVAGHHGDVSAEIPSPTDMPLMDLAGNLPETPLHRPAFGSLLEGLSLRSIRTHLDKGLGDRLEAVLDRYLKQLTEWRSHVLARMRQAFTAKADFFRAQCEPSLSGADSAAVARDLKRLASLAQDAPPDVRPEPQQETCRVQEES